MDWKKKLASRKFWLAIVVLVSNILSGLKYDQETIATVSRIIMSGATVIAYILAEGWVDAKSIEIENDIRLGESELDYRED